MNRVVSLPGNASISRHVPRHARYVTICSGRDGVGKTSVAVNLGIVLARMGNRVLLIDADSGVANAPALLGLSADKTLADVFAGECQLADAIVRGPAGLNLLCGGRHITGQTNDPALQRRLARDFQTTEARFDYILVDTIAIAATEAAQYLDAADDLLLVITPEPGSLSDTFAMLNKLAHRDRRHRLHLVVNQSPNVANANDTYQRFSATVRKYIGLDVACAGAIHRDEAIRNAFTLQHPVALYPSNDPSCQAFFRLAQNLRNHLEPCDEHHGIGAALTAVIPAEADANANVVNARAFFNGGERDTDVAAEPTPIPPPGQTEPGEPPNEARLPAGEARAADSDTPGRPGDLPRQFAGIVAVAEELANRGQLTPQEFDDVINGLAEVARRHFPDSVLLNRQLDGVAQTGWDDSTDAADVVLDPFEQSLLGTLKENRAAGKPLEQLLSEFIATKRSRP